MLQAGIPGGGKRGGGGGGGCGCLLVGSDRFLCGSCIKGVRGYGGASARVCRALCDCRRVHSKALTTPIPHNCVLLNVALGRSISAAATPAPRRLPGRLTPLIPALLFPKSLSSNDPVVEN